MKTFVIGSTGFLGYYTVLELLRHGHEIDSLSLTPVPEQVLFPTEVGLTLADFNQLDDKDILNKLTGFDGLIFAAGADDRSLPKKPAYAFFKKYNVDATQRLIRLARQAGVKRVVVFSSYFVHFARKWPELKLAEKHPYIRSRLDQIEAANEAAGGELVVNYLLLPYTFGVLPGKMPLWKSLVDYVDNRLPCVFYTAGGTAMVSVEEVARAAVAALERGEAEMEYTVVSHNLSWIEFIGGIQKNLGKPKPVITLPNWLIKLASYILTLYFHATGKESGLYAPAFVEVQTSKTFMDPEYSSSLLGYEHGDLDQALRDTVEACRKQA